MRKIICEASLEYLPLSGNQCCPKQWPLRQDERQVQSPGIVLLVMTQVAAAAGAGGEQLL